MKSMSFTKQITDEMLSFKGDADGYVRIAPIGPPQSNRLITMYDQFEPLGEAFGLPPYRADVRREWIDSVLKRALNLAALLSNGEIVGHGLLAEDPPTDGEMAIFVLQNFRRRGIGARLVSAVLQAARTDGKRRVWSVTPSTNRTALRLQERCGFRMARSIAIETQMVIDLS